MTCEAPAVAGASGTGVNGVVAKDVADVAVDIAVDIAVDDIETEGGDDTETGAVPDETSGVEVDPVEALIDVTTGLFVMGWTTEADLIAEDDDDTDTTEDETLEELDIVVVDETAEVELLLVTAGTEVTEVTEVLELRSGSAVADVELTEVVDELCEVVVVAVGYGPGSAVRVALVTSGAAPAMEDVGAVDVGAGAGAAADGVEAGTTVVTLELVTELVLVTAVVLVTELMLVTAVVLVSSEVETTVVVPGIVSALVPAFGPETAFGEVEAAGVEVTLVLPAWRTWTASCTASGEVAASTANGSSFNSIVVS
ncbi:MAG: hypothetical protein M1828_001198 [Chrysothrix sp. TS-e1954]|nr:MAG: hypothetical protein M1828_001198 [Chrysothrix sp. TS-e1954]